jgi:hypothetical protein
MSPFKKEFKKISILLGIGFILFSLLIIRASNEFGIWATLAEPETFGYLVYITLYPVGVVYGWDTMKSTYRDIRSGDRSSHFSNIGTGTISWTILSLSIATMVAIVAIAPVFGMIKAIMKLTKLKMTERELGKEL